ncbi:MAG: hypothetical protein M3514_07320 [Actinomycetota bacterium]|nr:hypothetical protein [Rubrobacteraceae bacterium]MDQ3497305.1 hypothetical protein [Actinomycetota bacterium]
MTLRTTSPDLIRAGGIAAILAGVFNAAQGIPSMVDNNQPDLHSLAYYLVEITFGASHVALLITFVALLRLHTRQGSRSYGRLARVSFYAAFIGSALMIVKTALIVVIGLVLGAQVITDLIVGFGVLYLTGDFLGMVGLALLGIATLRAGVLPRWVGLALVLGGSLWFFGPVLGSNLPYAQLPIWVAIGYGLLSYGGAREPGRAL